MTYYRKIQEVLNKKIIKLLLSATLIGGLFFMGIAGVQKIKKFVVAKKDEVIKESLNVADDYIKQEQEGDFNKLKNKILQSKKDVVELDELLAKINKRRWLYLTPKEKDILLDTSWKLEKDSLRIGNTIMVHYNDLSVNLYPRRDEEIIKKREEYWAMQKLIERTVRDVERLVYTRRPSRWQMKKLEENLEVIKNKINKITVE